MARRHPRPLPPPEPPLVLGDRPEEITPEHLYDFLILSEIAEVEKEKESRAADDAEERAVKPGHSWRRNNSRWIAPSPLLWAIIFIGIALGLVLFATTRDNDSSPADVPVVVPNDDNPTGPTTAPGLPKLVGDPWVATDGGIGYEFAGDGTYTWSTFDDQGTGLYRFENEGDKQMLLFVDPSDPSGLTILGQVEVRFEGDTMILARAESETRFHHGDLPVPGSGDNPTFTMDASTVRVNGNLRVALAPALAPKGSPVSDTAAPLSAGGTLTFDTATNTVSGSITGHFGCEQAMCSNDGTDAVADITVTITSSGPSTYQQMTWRMEGTATLTLDWATSDLYGGQLVPWQVSGTYDVTWTAGVQRAGWAVFDIVFRPTPADPPTEAEINLQFQVIGDVVE